MDWGIVIEQDAFKITFIITQKFKFVDSQTTILLSRFTLTEIYAKMADGKLTADRLTLTVNDVMLFVEDEPYHVVIALEDRK